MHKDIKNIIAYHGTVEANATSIMKQGFRRSTKINEWLGFGIYFFYSLKYAQDWACEQTKKMCFLGQMPSVLKVILRTPEDTILDLDIPEVHDKFILELDALEAFLKDAKKGFPRLKNERELRCYWTNVYCEYNPGILIVAHSFSRKVDGEYFDKYGFPIYARQFCVREEKIITDLERQVMDHAI